MQESTKARAFEIGKAFGLAVIAVLACLGSAVVAQSVPLEQGWRFLPDASGSLTAASAVSASGWRSTRAGISWNAQFDDLRDYMGVGWYQVKFEVPQFQEARRILLRFGAVDYLCEVFVNGKPVGSHEGGYTPFAFDLTSAVRLGWNELLVRVVDPPMDEKENRARFPQWMYDEIPHGKQNWYVQTGGIWQPVALEFRPQRYIERAHVTPIINGDFKVEVRLAGVEDSARPAPLTVTVRNENGHEEFKKSIVADASQVPAIQGHVASPQLWSPEHPVLYSLEATLDGLIPDTVRDRFGFRQLEARDGKLFLNGEPFYMRAALDQDFYPEGIYTPPSEEYVREMMRKGKSLGLNLLRCHIKVPDPLYLRAADEVGLLVWYEIPSWNGGYHFTPQAAERGEKIFAEMVERDWNHPSIVIQSVINESWGADLKQAEQRRWLRAAFERAKRLTAPLGRLIDDNSACCKNFHIKSDLDDFHQYYSIPDNVATWDRWTADFASRPKWSFSPYGDGERSGAEPLVVSEFGNWGLPKLPHPWPWWYGRDFGGREVTRPADVQGRFHEFQFEKIFASFDDLAEESQWHQFASLKHEIEEMRNHDSIQGYVITELTDINWEANGLMDMWRQPKAYAAELAKIQKDDLLLGRVPKHNYFSGERVAIETRLSHYGAQDFSGARVLWSTESGIRGQFAIETTVPRASVTPLQAVSFVAPEVEKPRRERLLLEARGRDGALLAENSYDIFIYPTPAPDREVTLGMDDKDNHLSALKEELIRAGYSVSPGTGSAAQTLLIATQYDANVKEHLSRGGRVVLLANSADALPASASMRVVPRAGSDLDGNWVTNFNWVRSNAAPFEGVAFTRLLGFESAAVVPEYVIEGVAGPDYSDVLSGVFYGWLNRNAALTVQVKADSGTMFLTTFRFSDYGKDPYATHLLDSILGYASSPEFAPKLRFALSGGKQ